MPIFVDDSENDTLEMIQDILVHERAHLGILTLNRPNALNALNLGMIQVMRKQLLKWEKNPNIHAVIVKSNSPKAFCAGGDVRGLYDNRGNLQAQLSFFYEEYQLNYAIHTFSKPYLTVMDGITMGGGVGISLHGSYPIATERFSFAMPETSIGFFPDIGASYLLSRCADFQGIYLGLSGERLNVEETSAAGLIKYRIRSPKADNLIESLQAMDLSTESHSKVSDYLHGLMKSDLAQDLVLATEMDSTRVHAENYHKRQWIATCFAGTTVESIVDALVQSSHSKNPLESAWAEKTLAALERKSPLSLKITLEQLIRAKTLSLADCLNMDYCLVKHFMQASDFYEGVRALLVDKDKLPKWESIGLETITREKVESYFRDAVEHGAKGYPCHSAQLLPF